MTVFTRKACAADKFKESGKREIKERTRGVKEYIITPMKCYFCQQFINNAADMEEIIIADCYLCSSDNILAKTVNVKLDKTIDQKNACVSAHLYVGWKNNDYHCLFHLVDNYFQIKCLTSNELIYYRKGIPTNFTPQNIVNKLKTYLIFS
jgi:hypothetical protein